MKVLVVAPQPFFTPRGTPFSVYYRTLVTAEQGADIDLLTYGPGDDVEIPGTRIVRIPRARWLEPIPVGPSWQKLLLDVPMIFWTIALLLRHRYDVVHAHEESVFWCRFLKPIFGFRLIYDMHSSLPQQLVNFDFTSSRLLIRIFKALENSSLKAADAVVTICPDLRDYVLETGVDPDRHLMIENSIFDEICLKQSRASAPARHGNQPIRFGPEHRVVLYAGTFESYQGINMLVEAFAKVMRTLPTSRLLLVGGTDAQVRETRALADSLGLGDSCVVTGQMPKTEVMAHLQCAQVLVSPRTHGTNTPMKIYEQLASGRPLVATRIHSHTQVLDDSICLLVDPTAESLAAGLLSALTDDAASAERARNAKAFCEREYSRPSYEDKIRRMLEMVA